MRATHGMQNNFDGSMHRRSIVTGNFKLWPSEPITLDHRSGSLGQLDNLYSVSLFSTRGLRPLSRMKENKNYRDPVLMNIRELFTRLFTTRHLTKRKHSSTQHAGKLKHTSEHG
jgi:hypothetical protein